jgi:hypothetical protein
LLCAASGNLPRKIFPNMAVVLTEKSGDRSLPLYLRWHRTAPQPIAKRYHQNDLLAAWKLWQKHLARRTSPPPAPFLGGSKPPLLWAWPEDWRSNVLNGELSSLDDLARRAAADVESRVPDHSHVIELLAAAYALPKLARHTPAETWWRLATRLLAVAVEAQQERVDWPADPDNVVRQQLLAGELPLALGYSFPELSPLRSLRKAARAVFSEALVQLTDGEGMPHARLLCVLGPLFACWTRARWLGERVPNGAWSRAAEDQYRWLVRQAIRLADANGRFLLTPREQQPAAWNRDLFSTALELSGDKRVCAAAKAAIGGHVVPKRRRASSHRLPKPSVDSEWSGIAVMAGGWSQSAARLAVAYAEEPVRIELSAHGERLLAGAWTFETTCDGKPARVVGEWENLFWSSEKSYDMLELGIRLSEGLRLERQVLLARDDEVLYLADVVISADGTPRRLAHSFHLPLDANTLWKPETESRDGLLHAANGCAAILPLALPEWRTDPRGGSLTQADGRLVLAQESAGRALYCPLLIDLKTKRAKKERTWRQLTVGESMEIIPRDVAVGFRAQCGRRQWLFYRSIGAPGNRTVLGQNISGEFCAGRFRTSGKLDEWIEVEAV